MKKISIKDPFFLGSILLGIVSMVFLGGFLIYRSHVNEEAVTKKTVNTSNWETYADSEYSFVLSIPRYLYKRVYEGQEGYIKVLVFGETQFSKGSGVAIAITDRSLDDEVSKTKEIYKESGEAELVLEKEVRIFNPYAIDPEIQEKGEKGIHLSYKPKKEGEGLVSRDILIVGRNGKTFVVSTGPNEIDYIIETFRFL
jgi:putative sterol carrier protein